MCFRLIDFCLSPNVVVMPRPALYTPSYRWNQNYWAFRNAPFTTSVYSMHPRVVTVPPPSSRPNFGAAPTYHAPVPPRFNMHGRVVPGTR